MATFAFQQVDVFTAVPLLGNPLAVVQGADALSEAQMAAFARWTNLSETTFLLRPTVAGADYRVRIFTTSGELPFAGHPTLGSCHVWLSAGGTPQGSEVIQECGVGLVRIRRDGARLAFAAPPLRRTGPAAPEIVAQIARGLRLDSGAIRAAEWIDNGPGWVGALLDSRATVLALRPDFAALGDLKLGVIGPWDPASDGDAAQFEVRAFFAGGGVNEDPVTGSLNASLAQWLIGAGIAPESYVASQGTVLGRSGRIYVNRIASDVWVGGDTVTCVEGTVTF
ncbi:MAG: PhzF family phenazine biosynthesis protein [Thermomicrobiales bacterium]